VHNLSSMIQCEYMRQRKKTAPSLQVKTGISIPKTIYDELRLEKHRTDKSISLMILEALEEWVEKKKTLDKLSSK
jgi:hypothetical protein